LIPEALAWVLVILLMAWAFMLLTSEQPVQFDPTVEYPTTTKG
jgi:hypothetical protein